MSSSNQRVEELFHFARGLADTAARQAYLERTTAGEPELRARVEELLAAERQADGAFLQSPAAAPAPVGERAGDTIGRYRLLQEIGQGGMGVVWMAEQREPVVRKVALKIVKLGLDTREVVVRFEAERQALALMDHPHIARVLDGGATNTGRPYFVMELVKGVPITDYCDQARLGLRERLELFTKVCEAIQHAHHKGVIHRDIKPSNVLVTLYDGVAIPKVIDFGIAKATSAELTKKTLFTQYAQILGTPEYMAPEQAELSGLDIDTRADVYSLGVLLYELLTGAKPFDLRTAMQAGFQELLRTIREDEPVKPSTRVSTAGRDASPVALRRELNVESWSARLRGDLDWIVLRALEKDRSRRYETPSGFAEDISRYLRDEPVLAAPPSAAYRVTKFVRRRKKIVALASLLLVTLLAGLAGTSWGFLEARKSAEAERAAKELSETRRVQAERNLEYARKGNEILGNVFARLSPEKVYGSLGEFRDDLRDGVKDAAAALEGASIGDPLEVARLQRQLGLSLSALGEHKLALALFQRAEETLQRELGPDATETLSLQQNVASALLSSGDLKLALPALEAHLANARRVFGDDKPQTLDALFSLGEGLFRSSRYEDAARIFGEARGPLERERGVDSIDTIKCIANLANAERQLDHLDPAIELYETALERARRALGPDHSDTTSIEDSLAVAYQKKGDLARAAPLMERNLKALRASLGQNDPKTMGVMNNLAAAYYALRRYPEAEAMLESVLTAHESAHGEEHPNSLSAASNLASVYLETGKTAKAIELLEKTLRLQRTALPAGHIQIQTTLGNLGTALFREKRFSESVPIFEQVYRAHLEHFGAEHQVTLATAANLATNYFSAGRYADSLPHYVAAHKASQRLSNLRGYTQEYLEVCLRLDKRAEAEPLFADVLAFVRATYPADSEKLATALSRNGQMWLEFGAAAQAEPLLAESYAYRERVHPDKWSTFAARSSLGGAVLARSAFAEAEPHLIAGASGLLERESSIPASGRPRIDDAIKRVVELYTRWNAAAPSAELAEKLALWQARQKARVSK
ncbi:MAG: tetratricopeptide repeat protein [Planctomycetes bacterium]|nr:tetratricopeptide repeat protein [Planctomycetota bacterium]